LDGATLRHVRIGSIELVEQLYVAVRDEVWNTIPARTIASRIRRRDGQFRVVIETEYHYRAIRFRSKTKITGDPDGRLIYQMDGAAQSPFTFMRIGLNVIHADAWYRARPFVARGPSTEQRGFFPTAVAVQSIDDGVESPLIHAFSALQVALEGVSVSFSFTGDEFETEDQRNWADASYKTFSTPLSRPVPFRIAVGEELSQSITIVPIATRNTGGPVKAIQGTARVELARHPGIALPSIGLLCAIHDTALTQHESGLLRSLGPAHLRVDADTDDPQWIDRVRLAIRDARELDVPLELAVIARSQHGAAAIRSALGSTDLHIARVIVLPPPVGPDADYTARRKEREAAKPFRDLGPLIGGTDRSFAELNRSGTGARVFDGVAFPACSAVHAADDWTLIANLPALEQLAAQAHEIAGGGTVHVGPITLSTRHGPWPQRPEGSPGIPPRVDPRQLSLLGAAWTLGSIGYLAAGGANTLTCHETTGWYGVMERDAGSPQPKGFPSVPGGVFPLYHVIADLMEVSGGALVSTSLSDPRTVVAMAAEAGERRRTIVANPGPRMLSVAIGPVTSSVVKVRRLTVRNYLRAATLPQRFRSRWRVVRVDKGHAHLSLTPYEIACIDSIAD